MKNSISKILLLILFVLLFIPLLKAQSGVGKLSGRIIDAATQEVLIGANVTILGTQLGAATDLNGDYYILNITPGTYQVKISYVGYAPKILENVRIVSGITYELNVDMTTDFTLGEVVVVDRKFFESKSTNTVKVIDSDQISRLPVKGVTNIVSLQSGVVVQDGSGGVEGNATINVRGGRGTEVLYIVDGVPQNNIFTGANRSQVSDNSIDQVSFQVGGYEAKYGQAQSGIVNITTKSGSAVYNLFADVVTSQYLDDYGYNLYNFNLSGPLLPGNQDNTFFFSAERGWFLDADPTAVDRTFTYSLNPVNSKTITAQEHNDASNWRFTGKTSHTFGDFRLNLGANYNIRNYRSYLHSYAKNNSDFNPANEQNNLSLSSRLTQTISGSSFWNLNLGYRKDGFEQYDPHLKDNLYLYGDKETFANNFGVALSRDGQQVQKDENNVFWDYGRIYNVYQKQENDVFNLDLDFTSQISNHLFEVGGGVNYNIVRNYYVNPVQLAALSDTLTEFEKFETLQPTVFGYDVTGRNKTGSGDSEFAPKEPIFAYGYIQDRFELKDLILNFGLRIDYFDTRADILKNPSLPFAGGTDPNDFDPGDFTKKKSELEFSPRIGLGFPVTESTVFHAQYGRFIQIPALTDLYTGPYDLDQFITYDPQYVQDGTVKSEETIQYEVGFKQLLGDNSAMNITLFYKNTKGLVNRQTNYFQRVVGGELKTYIAPVNSDFGTVKGLAFSLDVTRLSYLGLSLQYTFAIAEGTGSSTSSSQTAVFRNLNSEAPKVIAPLDYDQRHTGTVSIDFYVPKGDLGLLEMTGANMLVSFASGRPYTPLDYYDILSGNNGGPSTTGYVNSRFGPGTFRVDLKIEKSFEIGNLMITPYLWIQNLLDADNVTSVWRSTGDPYTTGFLNTQEGKNSAANNGEGYVKDYQALERDPTNFGAPRQIRLGLKMNFGNLTF